MIAAIFWFLAVLIILSGLSVVISRNIIHSAFSLMFTFLGVAGLYVLLHADFLAVTQIMVYVGGILTLLLFGVMLTNRITMMSLKTDMTNVVSGLTAAVIIAGSLLFLFWTSTVWTDFNTPDWQTTLKGLGEMTLVTYLIPFELIAIILLLAVIGASYMARKDQKTDVAE